LVAYFALTLKVLTLGDDAELSNTLRKRFGFSKSPCPEKPDQISSVLLAQLGKNDTQCGNLRLEQIMGHCMAVVQEIHGLVGGQVMIVECERQTKLRELYESCGFTHIQDSASSTGETLHQLYRTLKFA